MPGLTITQMLDASDIVSEGVVSTSFALVDVRTPGEYQEFHIPGSVNIPLDDIRRFTDELVQMAREKPLVLICRTGQRAEKAHDKLKSEDIDSRILDGGILSWRERNYPIILGKKSITIERQVRIVAGCLVMLGVALGLFINTWFVLLSGFVGLGLTFAGLTNTCGMAMLLAKLPFNRRGVKCNV